MSAENRRGIVSMLTAAAVFSLMDTGLKLLSPHYPPLEITVLRSLAALPLVLLWVGARTRFRGIFNIRWRLHFLRSALSIATLSLFTMGVRYLPLSEAYSLFFIAPMLITALSAFVLKERVEPARWIAIVVGLLGVLIVLRPTGEGVMTLRGLVIVGSALSYALVAILVRILGRTDSGDNLALWSTVMMLAGSSVLAAPGWVTVRAEHALIVAGIGVSGFVGQIAIIEAFRKSEASAVAPFEYSALAWGVTLDWVLWHVLPDRYTLLGAAVIIGSGLYLLRREKVHAEVAEHP